MSATFDMPVRIRFSHCDPAGIVFFPQYLVLTNALVEDWFTECLHVDYAHMIGERRIRAIGPACADENLDGPQPLTLLQQRTRQDQRLTGRLPPHHRIPSSNKGGQIDVRRLGSSHDTPRIA